jgi:hypothetical protein
MANYTWEQIENAVGVPIVLITFRHPVTKVVHEVTIEMLPDAAKQFILNWINQRL